MEEPIEVKKCGFGRLNRKTADNGYGATYGRYTLLKTGRSGRLGLYLSRYDKKLVFPRFGGMTG
jgi:hypothetical protein